MRVQFSPGQRTEIFRALWEAEERTSRYYCIPPHRWQKLYFDLLTRQDHEWEPLPESVLARLRPLKQINPERNLSLDFYRIELNDHSILTAADREDLGRDLYPFFLYILTHEMVHLVRLSSILDRDPGERPDLREAEEESRVDRISRQILSGRRDRKIEPVLSKFHIDLPRLQDGRVA